MFRQRLIAFTRQALQSWPVDDFDPAPRVGDNSESLYFGGDVGDRRASQALSRRAAMTLGRPLVSPGFVGCHARVDRNPRAILSHQAKIIVVLKAGAALESHGGKRGIFHLCSPLVDFAATRGCPTVRMLE